jgi:hypothetical protein
VQIKLGMATFVEKLSNIVRAGTGNNTDPTPGDPEVINLAGHYPTDIDALWLTYPACLPSGYTTSLTQTFTVAMGGGMARALSTVISISNGKNSSGVLYVNNAITTP